MASSNPSALRASDLFCFSHLRWNFVTQRPQHLLRQAVRQRRVFYWEEPIWFEKENLSEASLPCSYLNILQDQSGVWILTPHLLAGSDWVEGQRTLLDNFFEARTGYEVCELVLHADGLCVFPALTSRGSRL